MTSIIQFSSHGEWEDTTKWLNKMSDVDIFANLQKYGVMGVEALSNATPVDTGLSSESWSYEIETGKDYYAIHWLNDDVDDQGQPIVILLQYGHGTRTGGFVQGRDFINPAIRPIFDQISEEVWRVVND